MPETTILQMDEQHPVQPEQNTTWKMWAKVGAVFVGTTGLCLLAKTTGAFSLVLSWMQGTDNGQDDALAVTDENGYQLSTFDQALTKTEEIQEILSPAVLREQGASGLKLAEFEEKPFGQSSKFRSKRGPIEPVIVNNQITVEKGQSIILTSNELSATDADNDDMTLTFTVDDVRHGWFELVSDTGTAITRFSQQQVNNREIRFVHDGSNIVSAYRFMISDGSSDTSSGYASVVMSQMIPYSSEFVVSFSDRIYPQYQPSVTGLDNGSFVVTWASNGQDGNGYGIYGQMYNINGTIYGSEFQVNTYTIEHQSLPTIAWLNNGKFVITWESYTQDSDGWGIYGQMYNSNGTTFGNEFQVNTYTISHQTNPLVSMFSNGKFVITWESDSQDGNGYGIYGQMYSDDGTTYGNEFKVNTYTIGDQLLHPLSVSSLSDGKFVIVWESPDQDGDGYGIYGQMYNSDGTTYGNEFQVNTYTIGNQHSASVTSLSDGKFVVIWDNDDQHDIYCQVYNVDGTTYGSEFFNTYMPYPSRILPSLASLNDGKFVVVWKGIDGLGDSSCGIYGQIFSTEGIVSGKFLVNTYTNLIQAYPSVASLSDGKFVVTYQSDVGIPYKDDIYAQMYSGYEISPTLTDNQIIIDRNQSSVVLTTSNLGATDSDSNDTDLIFTLDNIQHGQFEFVGNGTLTTEFSQQQVMDGSICFVHDGSNIAPSYKVKISDGIFNTISFDASVVFYYKPEFISNSLTINEGQTVVLTSNNLGATDEDNDDSTLEFVVSNIQNGQFTFTNGTVTTQFPQQAIIDSDVQFVHDGSELVPSFNISVTDGTLSTASIPATVYFININDSPVIINNQLSLDEEQTVILIPANLNATDVDNDDSSLIFTAVDVERGNFALTSNPNITINTFIQQQVINGTVQFTHDGSEFAPSYNIIVSDGDLSTLPSPAAINFTNINDEPVLIDNQLSVNEGQTIILTPNNLAATDEDNDDSTLEFIVSNVQHGQFTWTNGTVVAQFPQQAIIDGNIQFVHDGSELAPSFNVSVNDGSLSTIPSPAYISFNHVYDGSTLVTNALTINEGQTVVLTPSNLTATDVDSDDNALTFTTVHVQNGQFTFISNPNVAIHTFNQQQVINGTVQFVHDGGELAPSYSITVSDGHLTTLPHQAVITFSNVNDMPVLINNYLVINEGQTVVLTSDNLAATDIDDNDSTLIFTVGNVQHCQFTEVTNTSTPITSFIQQQVINREIRFTHDGSETTPRFNIRVSDGNLVTTPTSANINFHQVNDRLILVDNNLAIDEGQTVVLTQNNLNATDVDHDDLTLTYMVNGVQHGQFEFVSNAGTEITSFTQQQINNQEVQFVHDGTEIQPSYDVLVTDGYLMTQQPNSAVVTFTNVNDAPVLVNNNLNINSEETVTLTESNLQATDEDNMTTDITFTVSSVQYGQFELVSDQGNAIISFTQQQVNDGDIQFVHDGSDEAPSYDIVVSDGTLSTLPDTVGITFKVESDPVTEILSTDTGVSGIKVGAVIGIAVGTLVGGGLLGALGFFGIRKCRQKRIEREEQLRDEGIEMAQEGLFKID